MNDERQIERLKLEVDNLRATLARCIEWFDSKEVRTSFDTLGMLIACGHVLAPAPVTEKFRLWVEDVWTSARSEANKPYYFTCPEHLDKCWRSQ